MNSKIAIAWLVLTAMSGTATADDDARASIGDSRLAAGDNVQFDEPVEGNAFAAGGRVEVTARIDGNAFLTGGDVTVSAPVGRNLYVAGGDLRIESVVYGKLRAAGGKIRIAREAQVDGNVSLAGASIEVDGGFGGNVRARGESIVINGAIAGDVDVAGESIRIGPDARIVGKVEYHGGRPVVVDPAAVIGGGVKEVHGDKRWFRRMGRGAPFFAASFSFGITLIGALMILGLPNFTREAAAIVRRRFGTSCGIGVLMVLGVPLMTVLLLVTVIGIPLALLFAFGYTALLLFGHLIGAIFVGDFALERLRRGKEATIAWRVLFLVLALIVIAIVGKLPIVGGLAVLVLFIAGIGAFTMRAWQGFRRDTVEGPATA